jgi:hypothetical protein
MNTTSSDGKEIKIPGPDHPITISPVEGKVRAAIAGEKQWLNRRELFGWRRRDTSPFTICRATMRTCRCWFGQRTPPIVRTRVIAATKHSHRRFSIGECRVDV